jgi:hypothetical protein
MGRRKKKKVIYCKNCRKLDLHETGDPRCPNREKEKDSTVQEVRLL